MNGETVIGLEFARVLQQDWNRDGSTGIGIEHKPRSNDRTASRSNRVRESAHQRLIRHIHTIAGQMPTRRETMDWLGRRLITWGWQLRIRHGAPKR